ncbi:8-amino-7-oxononanoate synthase [Flavobacterium rivuli WB 3.3-2 = DSM 21788]|uniref:8-amino-7-oxononanoate synthase n=1 Tax=Flavobacterium rivuli WB 3.3-2 = DSM 21788 TaxID=1121895 RepID=A0A0A2M664_9FLAO|nr:8-amino-7-oxononanoate synthase [Flavobacterium rivuli]KGO87106.1 8-amino-7-oxononanoate synthase [Flavobacterium rivuli WB 3.3-2 = DSM 21788]
MKSLPKSLSDKLAERINANALRQLGTDNALIDFSSNDYLGLSVSKDIFDGAHDYLIRNNIIVNGSTGSRLISGNHSLYEITEKTVADFHDAESALIFNSGYDANVGFFSCVPQKGDVVLYDEYIHASIRDGIRLSNATAYKFAHNNIEVLTGLVKRYRDRANEVYVVTESVFSMDGDCPHLDAMAAFCADNNCRLVVDEAHALGVFGHRGEGLIQLLNLQDVIFARIMTFGKGLGCHGAAILGSAALRSYLINFARSFIYTTALPPHSLATILTAYNYLDTSVLEKETLQINILFFNAEIERLGLAGFIESNSAIQCAVIPGNEKVKQIAATLQQYGFSVKAILSPTVPQGHERLRFCLHAYNTKEQVTQVVELLANSLLYP